MTTNDVRLTVTADKLAKMAVFRHRKETRYYLCGVLVEPHDEGALMVATDGHMLAAWLDRDGACAAPTIVAWPRYLADLCRPDRSAGPLFGNRRRMVRVTGSTAEVFDVVERKGEAPADEQVGTVANVVVDGTYPDWRRVTQPVPQSDGSAVFFNPALLARLAKITPKHKALQVSLSLPSAPARITMPDEPDFYAIVMPMRGSEYVKPSWLEARP